jgi:8-oxo-dGTP pyrophosphatase MutT (NUDIX family)/phosphohistidine phosphatase SixA
VSGSKTTGTDVHPDVVAAGAVLWRPKPGTEAAPGGLDGPGAGELEIALVHRPRYDDWSLPKGKLERGENPLAAAVREVSEETGITAALGTRLGESHYRVPQGEKVVHYWSARAGAGEFEPNSEVDELRWVNPGSADELLSYERDREVLDRFLKLGPPPRMVLLVRHAKAGNRYEWPGDDDLRPLSGKGRDQADTLGELLRLFSPTRAYAAPPVRCPQTIQPLADRLGLDIRPEPLLGEEGYWKDPEAGLARFVALADGPDVPVVCSQGGVIPDLVSRLTGDPEPAARKASTWVLGFTANLVVSADYYGAPE